MDPPKPFFRTDTREAGCLDYSLTFPIFPIPQVLLFHKVPLGRRGAAFAEPRNPPRTQGLLGAAGAVLAGRHDRQGNVEYRSRIYRRGYAAKVPQAGVTTCCAALRPPWGDDVELHPSDPGELARLRASLTNCAPPAGSCGGRRAKLAAFCRRSSSGRALSLAPGARSAETHALCVSQALPPERLPAPPGRAEEGTDGATSSPPPPFHPQNLWTRHWTTPKKPMKQQHSRPLPNFQATKQFLQ